MQNSRDVDGGRRLLSGRVGVLAERGDSEPTGKLTFSAVRLGEIGNCADATP